MKGRNNRNDDKSTNSRGGSSYKPYNNGFNILPSSRVLEEYESLAPGSIGKLVDMAKKEQEHRHSWQDRYLKSHNLTYRVGQLCGLIYNILLLYIIYTLVRSGNIGAALNLFIVNAILIAFAIVVTYTERKLTTRRPPRRGGAGDNRTHNQQRNKNYNNPNPNRSNPREHSGNRDGQSGNRRSDNS